MATYEVEPASKYSVEPAGGGQGSKYTVESAQDTPSKGPDLPQDQRSSLGAATSLRQGSAADFRQGSVADAWHSTDVQGPPTYAEDQVGKASSLGARALSKGLSMIPESWLPAGTLGSKALEPAMKVYDDKVLSKSRETLFGYQPPLDYTATPDEIARRPLTDLAKNLVSDPLMLGGGVFGASRVRRGQAGQPGVPITAPVRTIGDPLVVPPIKAAEPSIQDLARQSPGQQIDQYVPPSKPVQEPGPYAPRRDVEIGVIPTGSLERSLGPAGDRPSVGHEPALRTLPTGSMLRIQRPAEVTTAGKQYTDPVPDVPSMRPEPTTEGVSWDSRLLHGRPEDLPPAPFPLKTAEQMLAEKQAAQNARWEELQALRARSQPARTTSGTPQSSATGLSVPPALDPLDLLRQPVQAPLLARSKTLEVDLPTAERTLTQTSPSWYQLMMGHATDTLRAMGPYSGRTGDILDHIVAYSEAGTKQNFLDYVGMVEKLFGGRSLKKLGQAIREGDWRNVLNRSVRDYGMTQKEIAALVELHYSGKHLVESPQWSEVARGIDVTSPVLSQLIQKHVSPQAWKTLQAELMDPKIQTLFRDGWQVMTGRASSHPSVQEFARVHDVITGESTPVGAPSPYWPHQSTNHSTSKLLEEHSLRVMYKQGGYDAKGISFQGFVKQFKNHLNDPSREGQLRRFAGLENKRYLDMRKDAEAHSRTVYDSLTHYGYETDPLRTLLHHNMYALRRAKFLEHAEELKSLREQVELEYGHGPKSFALWHDKVVDAFQGVSSNESMLLKTNESWNIAQSIMYPAFLKASWMQNMVLQPNYGLMVTGIQPIMKGLFSILGKQAGLSEKDVMALSERSASNYPTFMAKYHMPDGLAEQWGKTTMSANWFAFSDIVTRKLQGVFFGVRAENLIKQWWKDPTNPRFQNALKEGKLDVETLRRKMLAEPKEKWDADGTPPIPPEYLMRYEQTMTNRAMGRTGIQSQPLWASGDDRFTKLFMMLHRQIISNEGVFYQNIANAPTAGIGLMRALRGFGGAAFAGTVYQGLVNWIMGNGFFDVNEKLTKQMGSKEAAFAVKAVLLGLGTFSAGLVLSGLNVTSGNVAGVGYGFVSPPAAAFIDEFVNKVLKGKFDEALLRLNPLQTPDVYYKRKKVEEQKRKQGGGVGLGTGIGIGQ